MRTSFPLGLRPTALVTHAGLWTPVVAPLVPPVRIGQVLVLAETAVGPLAIFSTGPAAQTVTLTLELSLLAVAVRSSTGLALVTRVGPRVTSLIGPSMVHADAFRVDRLVRPLTKRCIWSGWSDRTFTEHAWVTGLAAIVGASERPPLTTGCSQSSRVPTPILATA